jgi:hypothetical protein
MEEKNGMNSKDQNEETKEENEATNVCKGKEHPIEENVGERKWDNDPTKKQRR